MRIMEDLHRRLLHRCVLGDTEGAQRLVDDGADPFWYNEDGQNSLIVSSHPFSHFDATVS